MQTKNYFASRMKDKVDAHFLPEVAGDNHFWIVTRRERDVERLSFMPNSEVLLVSTSGNDPSKMHLCLHH